jgi:hypothetical protein
LFSLGGPARGLKSTLGRNTFHLYDTLPHPETSSPQSGLVTPT